MTSILRPTAAQTTRRLIVLATAIFAVAIAQVQMLAGWGQTPAEFAADSDATLRVAGYAFAIWGVIYAGLLAYAIRQVLPQTGESRLIHRLGWPSALAFAGIGLWIVASAMDWEMATIGLIFGSLIVLVAPLVGEAPTIRALSLKDRDRWLTVWPLALLAGWLTVASPLNLITVATGNGDLPAMLSPTVWAMLAIVAAGLLTLFVTHALRTFAFSIPVAWGLVGAFVAEHQRNPALGLVALAAAVAVMVGATLLVVKFRRRIERPAGA